MEALLPYRLLAHPCLSFWAPALVCMGSQIIVGMIQVEWHQYPGFADRLLAKACKPVYKAVINKFHFAHFRLCSENIKACNNSRLCSICSHPQSIQETVNDPCTKGWFPLSILRSSMQIQQTVGATFLSSIWDCWAGPYMKNKKTTLKSNPFNRWCFNIFTIDTSLCGRTVESFFNVF